MAKGKVDRAHKIISSPPIYHTSTTMVHVLNANPYAYQHNVHANCLCNEYLALTNRHLIERHTDFNVREWDELVNDVKRYFPNECKPVSYWDVIKDYTGKKRNMYTFAAMNLQQYGYDPIYAKVRMFVKPDRWPVGVIHSKPPRAIQYRSLEYNLELGRFIKPYEHILYSTLTLGVASDTRIIAKGLNQYERAELLLEKSKVFTNPVYLNSDHSKFDSHFNRHHLKALRKLYNRAFRSSWLRRILWQQIHNKCRSKGGIKYRTTATRMSGEFDTGCGACIINAIVLYGVLKKSGIFKYDILLDGDDAVIILERSDLAKLDTKLFSVYGFKTKIGVKYDIRTVDFCQSRLIRAQRPVMVRNPYRAFSHALASRKAYRGKLWKRWLAAVGCCEVANNKGVPIMQEHGYQYSCLDPRPFFDEQLIYRWRNSPMDTKREPITKQARVDLYVAWGIHPSIQIHMEGVSFTSCAYKYETTVNYLNLLQPYNLLYRYLALPEDAEQPWFSIDQQFEEPNS